MPDFSSVVRSAYLDILERLPDPGGLAAYDRAMNQGLSEADLREVLLRSDEFAARNPDPGLSDRLGLNVHIPSNAVLDDVAVNIGMRRARVDFDWFRLEPQRGVFRWEEWDRLVGRAAALGLDVFATLAYTPAWASSNPGNPRVSDPPASTGYWTDFVRAVVRRYRGRVVHVQMWNEPNITEFWSGGMARYRTEILEAGAAAAREAEPGVRIVAPGLAHLRDWAAWFRDAMRAEGQIDVVNHHHYSTSGREVLLELERDRPGQPSLRTIMRELGVDDRPFWLTETGLRSGAGDQRRYYEDTVGILQEKPWVERLYFFHYWDGPGAGNDGFGIVNEDFSPKPAYRYLQSVLAPRVAAPRDAPR